MSWMSFAFGMILGFVAAMVLSILAIHCMKSGYRKSIKTRDPFWDLAKAAASDGKTVTVTINPKEEQ